MLFLFAAALQAQAGAPSFLTGPIFVERRAFDCLLQARRRIRRLGFDPVLVDLSTCPPTLAPVRQGMPLWAQPPPGATDQVLIVTRAQLNCLIDRRRTRQVVDSLRYRLSFAQCPQ